MMHQKNFAAEASQGDPDAYLRLEGVSKTYGDFEAVRSLDLAIGKGELVALLGPSGCGKTTTLRMIAGLVPTSGGRITVGETDLTAVPPHGRDMGLVFQSYALFPHMTVARNVAFGLEMRSIPRGEIDRRVKEALAMVQLDKLAERRPRELSGGQQQRVALARALVVKPSILLLDEPLSNLDAKLRDEMRTQIRDIQQQVGITTVFVTHDQVEALSMCDRIVVMRNGRVEQIGTPVDVYERPATPFVASFVGRTIRLSGTANGDGAIDIGGDVIRSAAGLAPGPAEIMVRPHRIEVDWTGQAKTKDDVNRLSGVLCRITFVGDVIQYHVGIGDAEVIAEASTTGNQQLPAAGTPVTLSWRVEDTMAFGSGQ
ncbi:ABC transporter ATP-binding protein [Aquamicrobium sp. LC103]|uniref:ABC transporter ATP-binding protein n=1 Tax=Aquamicrobium sp. LC103 TaxID=1120658 RepID=UPI00063E6D73|nr:ABC transporter ATP-binding protein [Aquamicrobium sp. LC103]TKT74573.1 ABC transporter ATP-binding protein [Aquamicrobium sp. LC103]